MDGRQLLVMQAVKIANVEAARQLKCRPFAAQSVRPEVDDDDLVRVPRMT